MYCKRIDTLKKKYRRLFLDHVLQMTENNELTATLLQITLKDFIYWVEFCSSIYNMKIIEQYFDSE